MPHPISPRCRSALTRFKSESGAVTVEAPLWLAFFFIVLTMITDAALIFHGQARALEVAQDATREFTVGQLATNEDAEKMIVARLGNISPNASAKTTVSGRLITTVVTMPAADLVAVGFFSGLVRFDMSVTSQQVMEAS